MRPAKPIFLLSFLVAAVVGVGLAVSGCASPAAPSDVTMTSLSETIEEDSGVHSESTFVIRDADTFKRVWTQLFSRRTDREMPVIDFSQQMIVIATMGRQPTTGYGIRIAGARRSDRGLVVQVETISPGPTCVVAPTVTFPIAMSRLRRYDGPVAFNVTRTIRNCSGR